jgi:probable rRNA maturation factor
MMLEIIEEYPAPKGTVTILRKTMRALCKQNNVKAAICIVLIDDDHIRALKKQHWGEDMVTDVLTFPQWEPGDSFVPAHLGDIMIAVPTALRQATEHGHDLGTELVLLAAHGLTHLLGHDHQTPEAWQPFVQMEARARAILAKTPSQAAPSKG